MQIQNNYNTYSSTEYHKSHTHQRAESPYDQEELSREGAGEAQGKESLSAWERSPKSQGEQRDFYEHEDTTSKQDEVQKRGRNLLKQFWDSMGEEESQESLSAAEREGREEGDGSKGIHAAAAGIRHLFPAYITEKWETVRDRVKAKAGAAFQSFDKKKDAFLALSDFGRRFGGRKEGRPRPGKAARRPRPEILQDTATTHLMDSYSKRGEYCRLDDNLSYRRQRHEENRRAFSEREGEEAPARREERLDKRL